jgi:hypothetical protein
MQFRKISLELTAWGCLLMTGILVSSWTRPRVAIVSILSREGPTIESPICARGTTPAFTVPVTLSANPNDVRVKPL